MKYRFPQIIIQFFIMIFGFQFFYCQNPTSEDGVVAKSLFSSVNDAKVKGLSLTQSQSHMGVKKIQERIMDVTEGLAKNKTIITETLKKEIEYKNDYYVFYTAIPFMHLFQDVARKMYKRAVSYSPAIKDKKFQFMRYTYKDSTYDQYKNITDFLVSYLEKNGLINDREGEVGTILVSTNLALLGNAGFTGESTWYFYNNPQPWAELRREFLESSLKSFGYSINFTDDLIKLADYLKDDKGNLGMDLFQIFIPKKLVDNVGYLSWRLGIPFDKDFIKKLFKRKQMTFGPGDGIPYEPDPEKGPIKGEQYLLPTVEKYIEQWRNGDPVMRQMTKNLIENVKAKKFYLSTYLEQYIKNSEKVSEMNWAQGRLLISNDQLLNPDSGIIFYRYNDLDPKKVEIYKQKLKEVILKMEDERQERLGLIKPPVGASAPTSDQRQKLEKIMEFVKKARDAGQFTRILQQIDRLIRESGEIVEGL